MRSIETMMAEGQPPAKRRRRDPRIFDADGREVFVTMRCPNCCESKPLRAFGLRRMTNGQIRNCPWCRTCRSCTPREEGT